MKDQAIQLLNEQLEKLHVKNCDLKTWKKQTALLLMRIFGEKDPKVVQLEQLDYEFNSWSLRDATGNESYEKGRIQIGKDILEVAIRELEVLGMPILEKENDDKALGILIATNLKDKLKGSQVKQIQQIISADESTEEKQRLLGEILDILEKEQLKKMIIGLLMNENFNKIF